MTVTTSPKSAKCVRFKTNLWGNEKVGEKLFRDRNGVLFDLSPKVSPQRCHEDPDRVPSMASKVKHVHYDTSPILTQLLRDSEHENEKVNFESPALWERHRNRSPCDHDNSMFPRTCNVAPRRLQDSDDDDVDRDGAQALGKITQVRSSWTVPKRSHGWLNVEDEYFCTSEACEQKLHGSHRVWECQNVSATQELSYPSVVSTPRKNPSTRDTHGSGNAAHTSISMKGDLQMKHNRFTTGWTAKEEELKEILQSINQKLKTQPMSGKIHQDESRRKKTYSHPQRV